MTEYRKIVYMDVDTIALKNFDELFTLTGPAAFTGDFDAGKHVDRPNCGVFVAEPRIYSFKRLLGTMNHLDKYGNLMEQDFFKWIFRYSSIALPSIYNFMWTIYVDKQFSCALNREAKVFHFTVWSKSWLEEKESAVVPDTPVMLLALLVQIAQSIEMLHSQNIMHVMCQADLHSTSITKAR
jgi:hypothetical protein